MLAFPRPLVSFSLLWGLVIASCQQIYTPPNAQCWDYQVPVTVSAEYYSFAAPKWSDNQEFTEFIRGDITRTPGETSLDVPKGVLGATVNKTSEYIISATFCMPRNRPSSTVILATHGLGFDRSYWDLNYEPDEYNFAQYAIDQGYSIFFYDRLGVGGSSRVSGWSAQLSEQIQILAELSKLIKALKYTGSLKASPKIALLGHSFGSAITHGVTTYDPTLMDAVILTGYGMNSTAFNFNLVEAGWSLRVADEEHNFKDAGFDAGYITWDDVWTNILVFFKGGNYNLSVAQHSESHKTPFSVLEMFTSVDIPPTFPTPKFTGPVMLISGEYDFIFCDGYCLGVLHEPAAEVFSASEAFESYIQPGFGHGMNFHHNATGYFEVMTSFLAKNGL